MSAETPEDLQQPSNSEMICRVCRSEGTDEQPLFYPCKCSGSIKYIHQDCLVEWLKHSRKKTCELCKYPFTFSPVYAERMPEKIPLMVLLGGLIRQLLRATRISLSFSFAGLIWFLAVPIITSQIFRYYFGWNLQNFLEMGDSSASAASDGNELFLETTLVVVFDVLQGFLLTGFTVFLVLGMMLVREFISMIRQTAGQTTNTPITAIATASTNTAAIHTINSLDTSDTTSFTTDTYPNITPIGASIPENSAMDSFHLPTSPLRRNSEFLHNNNQISGISPLSPSSRNTNSNFWLDQVHPKEYRNYLRRRELHRELIEAEQQGAHSGLFESTEYQESYSFADDHISNVSATSTVRSRFTTITTTTNTSNVTGSFRCRVCLSTTCINRDHVIQATQIRNNLAAQRHQSLLQRTSEAAESLSATSNSNSTSTTTVPTITPDTPTTPPPTPTAENDVFGNWNLDAAESLSLPEFFGFTLQGTPILELLQNASIVIGCNTLVMHLFLFVPYITGLALTNGSALRALISLVKMTSALIIQSSAFDQWALKISHGLVSITDGMAQNPYVALLSINKDSTAAFLGNVILGYSVLCGIFSFYLKLVRNRTDSFHRVMSPILVFLGNFLKLISLLFIEMALFPFLCGCMIDFATLSLFNDASILSRIQWVRALPVSAIAVHWAIGAFFMITFASSVAFLRSFMRPGLLFFLRNPVDPDNHPVKEMIDRGFIDQIFRIGISVIFYAVLIGSSVGLGVQILHIPLLSQLIFPLNLEFANPLIEIPVDLLLHLMLRSLLQSTSPLQVVKTLTISTSKFVCRRLQLSSYFIGGGRYLAEETFPKKGTWVAVPDFDRLYTKARLSEIRARTVTPLDISKLKTLFDRNNLPVLENEASHSSNSRQKDWTVVFRPSHFKLKCLGFVAFTVAFLQVLLVGCFAGPLLTGRFCMALLQKYFAFSGPVHEIYTWSLGAALLLISFKLAQVLLQSSAQVLLQSSHKNSVNSTSSSSTLNLSVNLKNVAILLFKASIVFFFVGLVWPLLAGLLFTLLVNPIIYQQYISFATVNHQIKSIHQQAESVVIVFFAASWSLGFPLLRLLYSLRRHVPFIPQRTLQDLQNINNFTSIERLDTGRFFKNIAIPVTTSLLLCLLLPPIMCAVGVPLLWPHGSVLDAQNSCHLFGLLLLIALKSVRAAFRLSQRIISGIRDETYLIGRQLHNLEGRL